MHLTVYKAMPHFSDHELWNNSHLIFGYIWYLAFVNEMLINYHYQQNKTDEKE